MVQSGELGPAIIGFLVEVPVTLAQDQSRSDRHASFFIMARSDRNNFQYRILVLYF